jgi:hypothetical protein
MSERGCTCTAQASSEKHGCELAQQHRRTVLTSALQLGAQRCSELVVQQCSIKLAHLRVTRSSGQETICPAHTTASLTRKAVACTLAGRAAAHQARRSDSGSSPAGMSRTAVSGDYVCTECVRTNLRVYLLLARRGSLQRQPRSAGCLDA